MIRQIGQELGYLQCIYSSLIMLKTCADVVFCPIKASRSPERPLNHLEVFWQSYLMFLIHRTYSQTVITRKTVHLCSKWWALIFVEAFGRIEIHPVLWVALKPPGSVLTAIFHVSWYTELAPRQPLRAKRWALIFIEAFCVFINVLKMLAIQNKILRGLMNSIQASWDLKDAQNAQLMG